MEIFRPFSQERMLPEQNLRANLRANLRVNFREHLRANFRANFRANRFGPSTRVSVLRKFHCLGSMCNPNYRLTQVDY